MRDVESIHDMEGDELISALEERAALIIAQAQSSGTVAELNGLVSDAQMLLTQLPQGHSRTGTAAMRIQEAISHAQQQEAELQASEDEGLDIELGDPRSFASRRFQQKMLNFMSQEEQQYFNSIQDDRQYRMASIGEDGTVTQTEQRVEGAQLKEDLSRVKLHTLSDEQREGVELPEGGSARNMRPEHEVRELERLKSALERIKGHRAQELYERGASKEECKECQEHFEGAKEQVEQLQGRIEKKQELEASGRDQEARMENAMIQVDKGRLRNTLQKDVMDDELLDKDQGEQVSISGASQAGHGNKVANIAQIAESMRQQGVGRGE